uniref:Progonadoliberin n=1 Tax=Myripristis murdjan TaxID=586833 RepID=A0A667Z478_9TELE
TVMERTTLVLWLLLLGTLMPQGCCQHWSYGLSPGGKRELDSLSDTLIVGAFPQTDIPCSVLGCAEESPFAKLHRLKGLLVMCINGRLSNMKII